MLYLEALLLLSVIGWAKIALDLVFLLLSVRMREHEVLPLFLFSLSTLLAILCRPLIIFLASPFLLTLLDLRFLPFSFTVSLALLVFGFPLFFKSERPLLITLVAFHDVPPGTVVLVMTTGVMDCNPVSLF